jgi:hypothetical protein
LLKKINKIVDNRKLYSQRLRKSWNIHTMQVSVRTAGRGEAVYRTLEVEKAATMLLRRLFGTTITIKQESFGGGRTKTVNHTAAR